MPNDTAAREVQLGGLHAWIIEPESGHARATLVVMHGYGANGEDLAAFAHTLAARDLRFVLPDGPLSLAGWYAGGRAWWQFDFPALDRAIRTRDLDSVARHVPAGLADARNRLASLVAALERERGIPASSLVVGGFSQGSILALDWALHAETPPAALLLLSTMPVAGDERQPLLARLRGRPVFMSHGRNDPVLPFPLADRLRGELESAGARVTWVPFDGGHELPDVVFPPLMRFVEETTGAETGATAPP